MPKGTSLDESTSNSEKIKPVALAVIELCLPEGIRQAGRQGRQGRQARQAGKAGKAGRQGRQAGRQGRQARQAGKQAAGRQAVENSIV